MYNGILENQNQKKQSLLALSASAKPAAQNFSRYFIELHVDTGRETSRAILDQLRRQQALEFMQIFGEWVRENSYSDDIASMSVTPMGQVMMVCSNRVIDQIRDQDIWAIAHIRSSDQFSKLSRVGTRN